MNMRYIVASIIGFLLLLVAVPILFGWWYTIDQGERGVILRNGALIGIASPGLNFKIPIIDNVVELSVQSHNYRFENMSTYSRDQQPANLTLSVNWRIPPDRAGEVYERFRDEGGMLTRLVTPRVFEHTKNVFGHFNAVTAIQERDRLNLEIQSAVTKALEGAPILIESLQIENIDFSDAYEQSVEQRMLAEVEVAKIRQNAEREKVTAEITVIKAKAAADATVAEAEARANSVRLQGDAEASAIAARAKALASNPSLIELVKAEKWNGQLPTTMLPGQTVPFIDVSR